MNLIEIEANEGELTPHEFFRDPDVEVFVRTNPVTKSRTELVRISPAPVYALVMNPNDFVYEVRLCHTWIVEFRTKNSFGQMVMNIPIDDQVHSLTEINGRLEG